MIFFLNTFVIFYIKECIGSANEKNACDDITEHDDTSIKVNKLSKISNEFVPFEDDSNG